jgi:hypothetical protein
MQNRGQARHGRAVTAFAVPLTSYGINSRYFLTTPFVLMIRRSRRCGI